MPAWQQGRHKLLIMHAGQVCVCQISFPLRIARRQIPHVHPFLRHGNFFHLITRMWIPYTSSPAHQPTTPLCWHRQKCSNDVESYFRFQEQQQPLVVFSSRRNRCIIRAPPFIAHIYRRRRESTHKSFLLPRKSEKDHYTFPMKLPHPLSSSPSEGHHLRIMTSAGQPEREGNGYHPLSSSNRGISIFCLPRLCSALSKLLMP